jgi:hypothetical protein
MAYVATATVSVLLTIAGTSGALADFIPFCDIVAVPEIDGSGALSAMALLASAAAIFYRRVEG